MVCYRIQLNTVEDFRQYANMIVHFHIAGYLKTEEAEINMYDILDIMMRGPVSSAIMCLTACRPEELKSLEDFLQKKKLLLSGKENSLKTV